MALDLSSCCCCCSSFVAAAAAAVTVGPVSCVFRWFSEGGKEQSSVHETNEVIEFSECGGRAQEGPAGHSLSLALASAPSRSHARNRPMLCATTIKPSRTGSAPARALSPGLSLARAPTLSDSLYGTRYGTTTSHATRTLSLELPAAGGKRLNYSAQKPWNS